MNHSGAEIVLPQTLLRDSNAQVLVRIRPARNGTAKLRVLWTDVHGRIVEDSIREFAVNGEGELGFPLDLRRARAMKNFLKVEFGFGDDDQHRQATIEFIAEPDRSWRDWVVVMWHPYSSTELRVLKSLGVDAGQSLCRWDPPAGLVEHDMRWYAENLSIDFYAPYHRWFPDRDKGHLMNETKALYRNDPTGTDAFHRMPSLSDPAWLEKIRERGAQAARIHAPWGPLFYSLADEPGVAELATFWDFDFSPDSLTQMRRWLESNYGTLEALNKQWGTAFQLWETVVPDTTNQAMQRADRNWSSWSDHKAWTDTEFARALQTGADAIRSVDPRARVGIGGVQGPGWGGYDYAKLSEALDVFEVYDIGNAVEILRSLAPRAAVVTTSFAGGAWEKHRVWYELLHGNRGLLLWDEAREFVGPDGKVNWRGAEAAPYLRELRDGIATLLMNSERLAGPIAIHYSQASMRTEWMLRHHKAGDAWVDHVSSFDRCNSDFLRIRTSWCHVIEDLGLQYNFVSYSQMESGELLRGGYRVLILPWSSSISAQEARAIREFAVQGGLVLSDVEPGTYDEHSRRLDRPSLAGITTILDLDILNYHRHRLIGREDAVRDAMSALLRHHGIEPELKVVDQAGRNVTGVELHTFRNGGVSIAALHTNPQLRVDELGPPDFRSNERFETPARVRLVLPRLAHAVDVRSRTPLGRIQEWAGTLDPYEPVVLALFDGEPPNFQLEAPVRASKGTTAEFALHFTPRSPAACHVANVETVNPSGAVVDYYSGNLFVASEHATYSVPFAVNDEEGRWSVRFTDVLTGQRRTADIELS